MYSITIKIKQTPIVGSIRLSFGENKKINKLKWKSCRFGTIIIIRSKSN